jgi:hypothetical protein
VKKLFIIAVVALVSGCAHSSAPPATPYQEVQPLPRKEDNFDKAGDAVATGSRWVWDESKQAWQFVSSEEMQANYRKAWEATKEAAKKAYQKGQETYQEHK